MAVEAAGDIGRSVSGLLPTRSYGLKLLLVCVLALAMTIPALFVFIINTDRENRSYEVINEVSQLRGGQQTFSGPMVVAPYQRTVAGYSGGKSTIEDSLYVVHAEIGRAAVSLRSEALHRAIYDVPVYEADLEFTAAFDLAAARDGAASLNVDWSRARIVLGAWDLRGARRNAVVRLQGGEEITLDPTNDLQNLGGYGVMSAPLPDAATLDRLDVEASLVFSGSQRIAMLPFAQSTQVTMTADWPHPSFDGSFLPDSREVGPDGFQAEWSVPYLARGAAGAGDAYQAGLSALSGHDLGVSLVQPMDVYVSINRALKYAVMFIGIVFFAFFLFEVTSGRRAHAAQYVLIGLAQAIFYVLLLALAEHLDFALAFAVAGGLTVSAISLYAGSIYGSWSYGLQAFVVFGLVYGLLYVLLRLVDYALLMGALACFSTVAAAMLLTRRVDWYGSRAST